LNVKTLTIKEVEFVVRAAGVATAAFWAEANEGEKIPFPEGDLESVLALMTSLQGLVAVERVEWLALDAGFATAAFWAEAGTSPVPMTRQEIQSVLGTMLAAEAGVDAELGA